MEKCVAGRFEINDPEEDLLGRGGMGEVYRATDTRTGETVAVKALNPEVLERDPSLLERFVREGEALRQLNHPNIVRMISAVEESGHHYLVMEFVEGGSLKDLLGLQNILSAQRVTEISLDLADALTRAHRLGIIHRDLKPANVLLAKDGTPRLADFGIAHIQESSHLTQSGVLVGTVDYLSPEVCQGESPDELSDIWAFGVMLFEMLSGKLPFEGKNLTAKITSILTQRIPDLSHLAPNTPDALVDLIYRMLEKDPQQRIPSVRMVGAELEALLKGREPVTPLRLSQIESHFDTFKTPIQKENLNLPAGTVTFLFTDIEGSTKLARGNPETWEISRGRHDAILRGAIELYNGYIFQIIGDSFYAAFPKAGDALKASLKAQLDLQSEDWGKTVIRVRMGIHTGEAETDGKDYHGYLTLSLVQRVMSAGHGGQILLSNATGNLLRDQLPKDVTLRDMGEYILKDVPLPVRVFQVVAPAMQNNFPALRALSVFPNNLPIQITSFIGREKEIAEVKLAIREHRLVTLTGSGGTGKTRLSLQIAMDLAEQFTDGVWFVELAPLTDPALVPQAVGSVFGLREEQSRPILETVVDYLRGKNLLLILDNVEHLQEGAHNAIEILQAAPHVRILCTSRVRLDVQGEQLFHLEGMDFPDYETSVDALDYGAVKLFLQSARRTRPDFELVADNLKYVVRICRLAGGIPLGIVLAAAWVEMLTPQEIAEEMQHSLDFLATEYKSIPERQRSMQAVFDYSWNLLTEQERSVFRGMSVFRGGFTREAAQKITEASLRDLIGLVDKSLLQRSSSGRYNLHELVRQFGEQKLLEAGNENAIRQCHLKYYLSLAEQSRGQSIDWIQKYWLPRMATESDNLRAALGWCWDSENIQTGLQLAVRLGYFWLQEGDAREGRDWLNRFLSCAPEPTLERADGLKYLGLIIYNMGDYASSIPLFEESLRLFETLGDRFGIADTTFRLAWPLMALGNLPRSRYLLERSLELYQILNKPEDMSYVNLWMGALALGEGEFVRARELLEQTVIAHRRMEDKIRLCYALSDLGIVLIHFGELDYSEALFKETLSIQLMLGTGSTSTSLVFMGFAFLANARSQPLHAIRLLGAWESLCNTSGYHIEAPERREYESNLASLHAQLDESTFKSAWAEGAMLTLEQAVELALKGE
jgi:predicted ATPase/serine/threonine protein kinase